MNWNNIVLKLGAIILIILLAVLLPLGFIMNQIFTGFYYNNIQQQLNKQSSQYANSISSLDKEENLEVFKLLSTVTDQEIIIVNEDGLVIANSGLPSLPEGTRINQYDISLLFQGHPVQKEIEDYVLNQHFLSVGKPIFHEGDFLGGIFVLASVEEMYQSIDIIKKSIVLAYVGAIFLAIGFTFIVSRKLSNPLLEMEKATRKIGSGDLKTRVPVRTKDEIGSLAAAINDLAVELDRYRRNRREFFANVSHELRTPITYLEGYANVLEQGLYETDEEKKQYLQIIRTEAGRMSSLVNDLFDLSKMEEGKLTLHFEEVDLIEVIENALLKTRFKIIDKGLNIEFKKPDQLPSVIADGLRMEQIMINLIENATRYTNSGGIKVNVLQKFDHIQITVEDTGVGIPEEDILYVFERFYRVEKSRSREHGGTGLGLAIVKQLIELQNGTIKIKSIVGKGTCFMLSFPIKKEFNQ